MLRPQYLGIGVVVEKAELFSPRDEHREPGLEQERDNCPQGLRPGFRGPERRLGPVMSAHQRASASAARQKVKRLTHSIGSYFDSRCDVLRQGVRFGPAGRPRCESGLIWRGREPPGGAPDVFWGW